MIGVHNPLNAIPTQPKDQDRGLEAARAGDLNALGDVLDRFRTYLHQLARDQLGPDLGRKLDESDIVQETFLAARRDFGSFRGTSTAELRRWLHEIMNHTVISAARHYRQTDKRDLSRELSLGDLNLLGQQLGRHDSRQTPSGQAISGENREAIQAALMKLKEHHRLVLIWRYWDDLSYEEIGERLGTTADAARKLAVRALIQLRLVVGSAHDPF